jgi:hypothetical protein
VRERRGGEIFNASVENNYSSYWQAILVRDSEGFWNLGGGVVSVVG